MRTNIVTVIALALLGSFVTYGYTTLQNRPNIEQECKAGTETARLVAADDITKAGVHEVALRSVSRITISCSSLPGRKIIVEPTLISANFTIENVPDGTASSTGNSNDSMKRGAAKTLRFQITGMDAKVKSFKFPTKGITDENSFQILKDKSSVEVSGSSGTSKLHGRAEATLTNSLFSSDNPIMVQIDFQGTYNFATKTATLTKLDAHAHSAAIKRATIGKNLLVLLSHFIVPSPE